MIYDDNFAVPKTVDASNPFTWFALLVSALVSLVALLAIGKNKSKYEIEKRI